MDARADARCWHYGVHAKCPAARKNANLKDAPGEDETPTATRPTGPAGPGRQVGAHLAESPVESASSVSRTGRSPSAGANPSVVQLLVAGGRKCCVRGPCLRR